MIVFYNVQVNNVLQQLTDGQIMMFISISCVYYTMISLSEKYKSSVKALDIAFGCLTMSSLVNNKYHSALLVHNQLTNFECI